MLFKNTLIKIRHSFGRYVSILAIVFIGAGMFAGLASSAPDMVKSADSYYKKTDLMDFKVTSTMGITDADVGALRGVDGVKSVVPSYSIDALDKDKAIRVHAIEKDMNGYLLKNGRTPKKANECLGDAARYKVGDTVDIRGKGADKLKYTSYTVVGTIQTPLYISSDSYGNTTIGDGKIHSFVFVPRSDFDMSVYTEAYVSATETSDARAYSAAYNDAEKAVNKDLVALAPAREQARYDEVYGEASEKVAENQKKLDDEKAEGEQKLADAKAKLDDGAAQLANGKAKLASSKAALDSTIKSKEATFSSGRSKIAQGWQQVDAACKSAGVSRAEVGAKTDQLKSALDEVRAQLKLIPKDSPQYAQLQAQATHYQSMYEGLAKLDASIEELTAQQKKLDAGYAAYTAGIQKAKAQIASGQAEIANNVATLDAGRVDYEQGKATLDTKIGDAQAKLDEAKAKLADIEKPAWHIFSRDDITGYEAFNSATEVITAITKVFPIFFVLIVMLMTSNTMARMIVEERGELGTLASLGYSNSSIIATYLLYVLSASVLGAVIGYFVGCMVIPTVISGAFGKFIHPPLTLYYDGGMLALILLVVVAVMMIVTFVSCWAELRQEPAALMRPAPPKGGQKGILLERIKPVWNRMSFSWKVTMRNLFRSKRRALMIVIGVAGCTALLLTGFGLRDSINGVAEKQFNQIVRYDNMIVLKKDAPTIDGALKDLLKKEDLRDPLLIHQETFTSTAGNKNLDSYLIVPSDVGSMSKEFGLTDATSGAPLSLNDKGVIVTDKFAQLHDLEVGDTVTVKDTDEKSYEIPISGIAENYLGHYMYASPTVYAKYFGGPATYNAVVVQNGPNTPHNTELARQLVASDQVMTVSNNQDALEAAHSQNKSIDTVVILVVVIAALLAIVVLYNLTSINISERTREVATLKVLGFTDRETDSYIYRESLILTILAIIVGYGLGLALHGFAINIIEGEGLGMFRTVLPLSYLYSALIVIALALIMQLITHLKLKKIDMIDSLKSVE